MSRDDDSLFDIEFDPQEFDRALEKCFDEDPEKTPVSPARTTLFEREETRVDVFQPKAFKTGVSRHPTAEMAGDTLPTPPPTPARVLCCQAERKAPQITWQTCGARAIKGFYRGTVNFDVHAAAVKLQPMIVEMWVKFEEYPLRFESRGALNDAWRSLRDQLDRAHKDLSVASFFIGPRR